MASLKADVQIVEKKLLGRPKSQPSSVTPAIAKFGRRTLKVVIQRTFGDVSTLI